MFALPGIELICTPNGLCVCVCVCVCRVAVRGCCGTVNSTTSIHETWTVLLQVTSPAPGRFSAQGSVECLSDARLPNVGTLGGNSCVMATVSFCFVRVCTVGVKTMLT